MQKIANNFRIAELDDFPADVAFRDQYKLRLSSKRLSSGKCQVKFFASMKGYKDLYGYVLVDSELTLREVVVRIKDKLLSIQQTGDFHHIHLYSIGREQPEDRLNFIIFDT